ncbi:fumarylacetoacetate hydrolase family protein [bacterium]|nr:fumarylacetoacetate hydrolase family protein [bacterium]
MKFATLKYGDNPDGSLGVLSRDLKNICFIGDGTMTLREMLENWHSAEEYLQSARDMVDKEPGRFGLFRIEHTLAPLPRASAFLDGSAYLTHVERVRKARGAEIPKDLYADPLMYEGASTGFPPPIGEYALPDESWGLDFEGEIGVITDFVPQGTKAADASKHIKLLVLLNDWTYRNLVPNELAKGFGFLQSKPPSSFGPIAVTPDELGDMWDGSRLHAHMNIFKNGLPFGNLETGDDMHFGFDELIAHAAKTRNLMPGTIIGSGTVSNSNAFGTACIVEKRMVQILESGKAYTPYLTCGESVTIRVLDNAGQSIFGEICHTIKEGEKNA